MKQIGMVELCLSKKVLVEIDREVSIHTDDPPCFGSYTHEWATSGNNKGKEKKPPKKIDYWSTRLASQVLAEIELFIRHYFLANADVTDIPSLDYEQPGCVGGGLVVLFGGDHGDKACPISVKLNLQSPKVRKELRQLNEQCPTLPIASINCSKDTYEILQRTVMPQVRIDINELRGSSVVAVYDTTSPRDRFKCCAVPKTVMLETLFVMQQPNKNNSIVLKYHYRNIFGESEERTINLDSDFEVSAHQLNVKLVVTNFHDFYVGDLAFLAMLLGMVRSEHQQCILCTTRATDFNLPDSNIIVAWKRTVHSLQSCLRLYQIDLANATNRKQKPANHKGVNQHPLLDVDPQRVLVPLLHTAMGLVDKVLESFKAWINLEVELPNNTDDAIRQTYKDCIVNSAAKATSVKATTEMNQQMNSSESLTGMKTAKIAYTEAKQEEAAAKSQYDDMIEKNNARLESLNQRFEDIYQKHGITRLHYHGGKFNGVNCIRIMEKAELIFVGTRDPESPGFASRAIAKKVPTISDEDIRNNCGRFGKILALLDVIWSRVQGVEHGLLPTDEDVMKLEHAIDKARELWLTMGLGTKRPKWHLLFDGHLLHQYKTFGGLADKADDFIEKEHQVLKKLRDRYRTVPSFQIRTNCMLSEIRRQRSKRIQHHISSYNDSKRQKEETKRKAEAQERQQEAKKAKTDKRGAAMA
jgi:hypothetical protein